jgi:flagellar L-ring protein precursor FlgH
MRCPRSPLSPAGEVGARSASDEGVRQGALARRGRAAGFVLTPALLSLLLAGCNLQRLSEVGRPPEMTPSSDPTKDPAWRPLTMPMPGPKEAPTEANALWRAGSRAFFKDQRAAQVGDVITVVVNMNDAATWNNATSASRNSAEGAGLPNLFGFENLLPTILPKPINPSSLVSVSSSNNNGGTAQLQRNETVTLRLAGVVTQVLPNGNLVVVARQEIRVNSELRQLEVTGVMRPQDIASDNTVQHDRMAEARISYGGRGQMTDVQTPRWGQQIFDQLMPW